MGPARERGAFLTLYNGPGRVREVEGAWDWTGNIPAERRQTSRQDGIEQPTTWPDPRSPSRKPASLPDARRQNILIQPGALPERSG
jgi:hypothetical protein